MKLSTLQSELKISVKQRKELETEMEKLRLYYKLIIIEFI